MQYSDNHMVSKQLLGMMNSSSLGSTCHVRCIELTMFPGVLDCVHNHTKRDQAKITRCYMHTVASGGASKINLIYIGES